MQRHLAPPSWLSTTLMSAALLCCAAVPAFAQTPATVASEDPIQREVQPKLEMDRDPVLSPDVADNQPKVVEATPAKAAGNKTYTLRQDVDEVLLRCAVVDAKGNLVSDLKEGDFRIWEEGVPQKVSSFQHRDQPASIGILVDNSGSMLDKRSAVNAAALALMRESNSQDTAFVVNFSDRAYLDQGFTSDLKLLAKGLEHFDSKGMTAMYDAVAASADELSRGAKWPEQVLLIITDGRDDASRLSLEQTVRRVQQLGGPVVYSIGLLYDADNKGEAQSAHDVLETLSADTGGIAYFPHSLDEVNEIASEVARDIRNQYILGYHPAGTSGAPYREVRVEAEAKGYGHLVVRTRKGYYSKQAAKPGAKDVAQTQGQGSAPPQQP